MILFAYKIYVTNRKCYNLLRSMVCTLPHPSSLNKLSTKFSISSGLEQSSLHKEYLLQRALSLDPIERDVCLLIDEIHVSHQISYQGDKIEGTAAGNASVVEASTAQVSSLLVIL